MSTPVSETPKRVKPAVIGVGSTVGLFSGIGGLELGTAAAGLQTTLLCESDERAAAVLARRFVGVPVIPNVADLTADDVRGADVLTGGFPCQDLSQAGRLAGITGANSGLVQHMLRLLAPGGPHTLLVENVPFMLALHRGGAIAWLTHELERRGYSWAYRVVDSRAFGLPQRRRRVILVASRSLDPRGVLLNQDEPAQADMPFAAPPWCGFYWTEGNTGLGWAVDAIPPLKGGSGLGIPSSPAIWQPEARRMATPGIRDAEALQGFERGWTMFDDDRDGERGWTGGRWRMVGNAVNVPVAEWVGRRIVGAESYRSISATQPVGARWPRAAWGGPTQPATAAYVSDHPVAAKRIPLSRLVKSSNDLSAKATYGFFARLQRSRLSYPPEFLADGKAHLARMNARRPPA